MKEFVIGFLTLGLVEAIVKPLATWIVRQQTNKWLPQLLDALESVIPEAIGSVSREELEQIILQKYSEITGQELIKPIERSNVLKTIEREYSPLIAAEKLSDRRSG